MSPTSPERRRHSNPSGRPTVKGAKKKRKGPGKRSSWTYEQKYRIIVSFDTLGLQKTLADYFPDRIGTTRETNRKAVSSWAGKERLQITFLAAHPKYKTYRNYRPKGTGTTLSSDAEEMVKSWVLELRADGVPVTRLMVHLKALEVALDEGISFGFAASPTWMTRFLRQHHLSDRATTRKGQMKHSDSVAVLEKFQAEVLLLCAAEKISKIYNADQTGT
jgi:hypothetical protein